MGRDSPGERRSPRAFWVSKGPFQPHSAEFRHPPGEPGDVITAHGVRMLMAERHERDGEDVLRLIAQKERELEAMVARAREEAGRLVEQARREGGGQVQKGGGRGAMVARGGEEAARLAEQARREVEAQLQKAREEAARVAQEYEARAEGGARQAGERVCRGGRPGAGGGAPVASPGSAGAPPEVICSRSPYQRGPSLSPLMKHSPQSPSRNWK